jgi:phycocyanobilin:ferredoxin oxidoreductase
MDWSPVDNALEYRCSYPFEKPYPLPDWAKIIFSPTPLAIIPTDNELEKLTDIVHNSFEMYMKILEGAKQNEYRSDYIVAAQNRYCDNQQKNERTYNVLKAKLGEERAKYFMQNILFPKID